MAGGEDGDDVVFSVAGRLPSIGTTLFWRWTQLREREAAAPEHPAIATVYRGVKCELWFKDLRAPPDPPVAEDEVDPILGFPSGRCVDVPELATTRGGGYFLLPGLRALRFIARCS